MNVRTRKVASRWWVYCLLLVCLAATIFSISRGTKSTPAAKTVGVILPLTGFQARMGEYEMKAMQLAYDELKTENRSDFRIVYEDSQSDKSKVPTLVNKLLDVDGSGLVITVTTGASLVAQPILTRRSIPQLAFCQGGNVAPASPITVRYYLGVAEEAAAILDYLKRQAGGKRIAILHVKDPVLLAAIPEHYKPALTSSPLHIEEYDVKNSDFRPQLFRIKEFKPDILIILGYGFEFQPLFQQLSETGARDGVQICGGWAFLYTPLSPEQLEGIIVSGPKFLYARSEAARDFQNKFSARFGFPPNFDAAFAYEVVRKMPMLLKEAGKPSQIKPALVGMGVMTGPVGDYRFDKDGNMIVETGLGLYTGGKLHPLPE